MGVFPYASTFADDDGTPQAAQFMPANAKSNWFRNILPYIDQQSLYNSMSKDIEFNDDSVRNAQGQTNRQIVNGKFFSVMTCPSNPLARTGTKINGVVFADGLTPVQEGMYLMSGGPMDNDGGNQDCNRSSFCVKNTGNTQGGWRHTWRSPTGTRGMGARGVSKINMAAVMDGTSNTLFFGESKPHYNDFGGIWAHNVPTSLFHLKINSTFLRELELAGQPDWSRGTGHASYHTGGAHFLMVDGSVRMLNNSIDYVTYCNLGDRMDGNVLGEF